jgi:ABC-type lipoprotein release transport system permease subunit
MKYVFKELRRHLLRTIFSITGYIITTVFLLIIFSINSDQKEDSFRILKSTGTHFIIYIPTVENCCISNTADVSLIAEGVNTLMIDNDLLKTIKDVEGIRDAAPCLFFKMYHDKFNSAISLAGIDTNSIATRSNTCARTNLIAGKFLSANPHEIVAEESFAIANNLTVGDTLNVFGGTMILAGIVNSGIKPIKADFYTPIGSVRSILKDRLQCKASGFDMNIILVEVADSRLQDNVIKKIKNMMYKFSVSSYNCYEPAYRVMSIIDNSSAGLTILIIVFLIIFSAKTQITALIERIREIGILKSLGWSDFMLSTNILLVSLIQSLIGVTMGILLGIAIIQILNNLKIPLSQFINFRFQNISIPLLYSLSLIGALIASVFPIFIIYRKRAGDIMKNYM